jgi:hypothetical protein
VLGDEIRDGRGRLAAIGARLGQLGGDILAHVPRPAFSGIESDDADRRRILALEQVADQRGAVCVGRVGLGPRITTYRRLSRCAKVSILR